MAQNANKQSPATLNQIENTKPAVPRSFNMLEGDIAGTMNGGHYKTIAFREVMASEKIAIQGARMNIQMATPRTPAYQKLKAVVKVYNVPHQRVWENYYKFKAQNGGSTVEKIANMPNFGGKNFSKINFRVGEQGQELISIQETTAWRDNIYACYIPRVGTGIGKNESFGGPLFVNAPPINALACRGWTAIWNDEIRNKEYEDERTEYKGDTVSEDEWSSYIWDGVSNADFYTARARRNNSYYTNYRTELQGYETQMENMQDDVYALNWASFEAHFAETRSQAENAQMNPWDVAQKLSGAKKLTEGRVQLIATREFPINYSAITQNAYNNNENIEEKYRVMGMQGAYSYTEIDLAFLNGIEIAEDGYIHVLMCITADTVFESAVERILMNNNWEERYRPDLKDDKLDVMYACEFGTPIDVQNPNYYSNVVGFKRKYSEYFKLNTCLNGEVYNRGYYQIVNANTIEEDTERIIPNDTYQFFEFAGNKFQSYGSLIGTDKKIWLDYTDMMINKNLAVRQLAKTDDVNEIIWKGPNQIVYFGKQYCLTDMPIAEEIKNNYTKFGEH